MTALATAPAADGRASPSEVGGKAAGLERLRAAGFPVPPFAVVPRAALDEALGDRRPLLRDLVRATDASDPAALARAEARAAEIVASCEAPPGVGALLAPGGPLAGCRSLAVRSSAIDEDSSAHSFAGLMDSVLNVGPGGLPAAVKRVWASAWSARALLYRRRKGLDHEIATAVVVQAMVPAAVSGVLFTRDPRDGSPAFVIAAGLGLGEGVVTDAVETDTFRVLRDSRRIVRDVRSKESRVVPSEGGGTRVEPVPRRLRARPALSDREVRQLCRVGARIEACLGGSPQDVEWAFDGSGRLFVLQARPIVAAPPAGRRRIWDNANVVESYPGLTLPLTFSFVRRAYARTFRGAARAFLPLGDPFRDRPRLFESLVGLLDGRVYYNLLAWYEMFSALPAPERHRESWDRMLGITGKAVVPSARVGPVPRIGAALSAFAVLVRPKAVARRFFRRFQAFHERYREAGASEATPDDLVAAYRSLEEDVGAFWHLTIQNDLCAMKYHEWLTALCRRFGLEDLENALLAGEPGVESVAPLRSVVALAALVRSEPRYRDVFAHDDDRASWERIGREEALRPLADALERHRLAYGDRGLEELKLETPTFREDPARLVGLVRRYCALGLDARAGGEREAQARREAEAALGRRVRHPPARALLGFILARARAAIRERENMRLARSRLFGIVRRLFRRLGSLFAGAGLLDDARDVFYLSLDELFDTVEGTAVTRDLRSLVRVRRAEYADFAGEDRAGRLVTIGVPSLGALGEPEAVPEGAQALRGTGCSTGRAEGVAQVVTDPERARPGPGRILVAKSTDPGWIFLMAASAGLVVERGSPLSHTAIIGRELGIPTVVGVPRATRRIPDGAALAIDGGTGEVRWR